MSASPKTLLLRLSFASVVAVPSFVLLGDAHAQTVQGPALTPYPACTIKPTPQDSEAAHSAYLLGKRFFEESDYGLASHNFIDAYKLDCTKPELLLNIARANELLGSRTEAVHALEVYLQRGQTLSADDRAQLQRRIDNLKAAIAAQAAAAAATAPAPASSVRAAPAAPVLPPPPPHTDEHEHTALPWVVVGIGAAAAISGGVLYLVGQGDINTAESACTIGANPNATPPVPGKCPNQADANKASTGSTFRQVGGATFLAGLGVTGAGILWHFLEPTGPAKSEGAKTSFSPVVAPGYTGATVVGVF